MKKIILILTLLLIISSCGYQEKNNEKNSDKKLETENFITVNTKKEKQNYTIKNSNLVRVIDDYNGVFKDRENNFYENNDNIEYAIMYIKTLENQGLLDKKEKEYAKLITKIATETLEKLLKSESEKEKKSELLRIIGNNFEILKQSKEAINFYKQSILEDSNNYKSYIDLYNLYKNSNNKESSQKYFIKGKNIIQNNKIIEKYNNSIKKKPKSYSNYIELVIIYNFLNEKEKENINIEKAKKTINEHPFLSENIRNILIEKLN